MHDAPDNPRPARGWRDTARVISTIEDLEELGTPTPIVRDKVLDVLHDTHIAWLAATPLAFLATAGADGRCDVSPKGDPAGFVKVLDRHTVAVPERPGNRRMDGHHNILANPHIGMICVIPGRADTMRLNGRATLVRDASFMDDMRVRGHRPTLAVVIDVEEVFFHCPKSFRRADAWDPSAWRPDDAPAPADIALALWRKGQRPEDVAEYYRRPMSRDDLYTTK
jgi:PPOX class probable FMN-dependent enzyme